MIFIYTLMVAMMCVICDIFRAIDVAVRNCYAFISLN